jgi:SNF2 family DNA or RNA helicase
MRATNKEKGIVENEYLVKFVTWSHRKCFWVPESWLILRSPKRLRRFQKAPINLSEVDVINENWCRVDRIMYEEPSNNNSKRYLVKWRGLAPDMATWEDESNAGQFFLFNAIEVSHEEFLRAVKKYKKSLKINRHWSPVDYTKHKFMKLESKDVPVDCQLMQYQLDGVNWMLYNWHKGQNCLLADEMGLGKTVQTITLIEHLRTRCGLFPVLVIAPSTVCENWVHEMNRWSPKIHHVLYGGMQESRDRLCEYELFNDQMELSQSYCENYLIKNHVLVTSFQTLSRDCSMLKRVPWQMIVVDEAHRLKGSGNLLARQLEGFKPCFRLLLTGTPLQNNVLSRKFEDLGAEKDKVRELHKLLRPRILRRTKREVGLDESIPPKREIIVPVSMSDSQMAIYKSIIEKNYKVLANIGSRGNKKASLLNIWMELRKCVNHAYLIIDEPLVASPKETLAQLLGMSGKLELLDKMLEKLQSQAHRVLIFSQMTRMLDM